MRHHWLLMLGILGVVLGLAACGPAGGASVPTGDVAALVQEAKTALNAGNPDLAITKAQQAIQLDARSAEAHFLLGNAYARKEQYNPAEAAYQQALKLNPKDADARSNLGVVYYRQGRLPEAEQAFRAALELQPNDAEIHYNLGGVLTSLNQFDAALVEFNRAKELNPALAEVYLGLGMIYKAQGKNQEAITALREYLKRATDPTWRSQAEQMLSELGAKP